MNEELERAGEGFLRRAPAAEHWSLRLVEERRESLSVRQGTLEPLHIGEFRGAHLTVAQGGGTGYAATSDLSPAGLARAAAQALDWARATAGRGLIPADRLPRSSHRGEHRSPVARPWRDLALSDKVALLHDADRGLDVDPRIVERLSWLSYRRSDVLLLSSDGARIAQRFEAIDPGLRAAANQGADTQWRTGGGARGLRQGGLEWLEPQGFPADAGRVAEEALALLAAPECPGGLLDLVLTPSQMALQIHESIGHPLELDRILGDERNYAGTSFVTPEMFGSYRYGSPLLNVTFDPGVTEEAASYAFDDEGSVAERVYLIRAGILERPLGGALSQARAGLPGTANARSCSWDRPAIDRMANLNLEPGDRSVQDLIASVERGVLMDTNRSWSIDDSRNKFQFGCELGRLIEGGRLGGVVRNPNYRGVSESFWRSLDGVADRAGFEVHGVNNCGKGEPNQMIHVGHASPTCLFRGVEVFGGGA